MNQEINFNLDTHHRVPKNGINRRFFLLVATASASPLMATNDTPGLTRGELNGDSWVALTADQRSIYTRGLLDGCAFATKQLEPILNAKAFQVAKIRRLLETATRYSVETVANQVDNSTRIKQICRSRLSMPAISVVNFSWKATDLSIGQPSNRPVVRPKGSNGLGE